MFKFIRHWSLPIAMLLGALGYILYRLLPPLHIYAANLSEFVSVVQPVLIFCMLLAAFCKVDITALRPTRLHFRLLLIQIAGFMLCLLFALLLPHPWRLFAEAIMICVICPTATASAVVTQKLGGNSGSVVTYVMLINFTIALVIPAFLPMLHPRPELGFWASFGLIISRVFPVMICPLLMAEILRRFLPRWHQWIVSLSHLSFSIWLVALSIAIAMTARSIYHSHASWGIMFGIALGSMIACVFQFWAGQALGRKYGESIAASQSLGQKNTIFAIWLSYTYLSPIISLAGGFYSIWHNVYNSYQLAQQRKEQSRQKVHSTIN